VKSPFAAFITDNRSLFRFARFAVVGGVSSLVYVGLVMLFIAGFHLNSNLSAALGYALSVPVNYIAHRKFSFRSAQKKKQEVPRFVLVHLCNMAISVGGMFGAVNGLGLPSWMGAASAAVLVPLSTFLALHLWVFKPAPSED